MITGGDERGMQLKIALKQAGAADGDYCVKAKGCLAVSLYWADSDGGLPGWTAFAYIPISAAGVGYFHYSGGRAIPAAATHVMARGISSDFAEVLECVAELPEQKRDRAQSAEKYGGESTRFVLMSDIHLTDKSGRLMHVLKQISGVKPDALLLPGDLVNDGKPEQFALLQSCLEAGAGEIPVCCAAGNHDFPIQPIPQILQGICSYPALQSFACIRNERMGYPCEADACGAYAVQIGGIDVAGLNAVSHRRRFVFGHGEQLSWLRHHLQTNQSLWHVVLCHAPLLAHNPQRQSGSREAYLSRDRELQEILDAHHHVIFVSGHTHISPNIPEGCVEFDPVHNNLYINDGSLCPTELKDREVLTASQWAEGVFTEISIAESKVEISVRMARDGLRAARGYYEFRTF